MTGAFFHRPRPSIALIWFSAAAACACHPSPGGPRVALPSGPAVEVRGARPAAPIAPAVEAAEKATGALGASCGGPKAFHVVARAASVSDPEHQGFTSDGALRWRFRPEALADRTLVAACLEPLPQGCVQTHLAELADGRWVAAPVPTTGLPPLTAVNLLTAPGTPFREAFHEAGPPLDGDEQEACDYYNMMEGTVSLTGLYGEWPGSAWAKVTFAEDHSGIPYDQLYRWDGTRWRLRHAPKRFGTYVEAAVPWHGGLAVVAVENAEIEPRWRLVHLGDRDRVLIPRRTGEVRLGIVAGALVAVSTERGAADTEKLRVVRWVTPQARPAAQTLDVPAGSWLLAVSFGDEALEVHLGREGAEEEQLWRFDRRWVLASRRALGPEEEGGDPDQGGDAIECQDLRLAGTAEALDIREQWRQGDRLWLEVDAPGGGETWLLGETPVDGVWRIPAEPLIWPPRPQCPPGKIPEGFGEGRGERLGGW
jgi:hypothetical protein